MFVLAVGQVTEECTNDTATCKINETTLHLQKLLRAVEMFQLFYKYRLCKKSTKKEKYAL
jgi:hypothetical protein